MNNIILYSLKTCPKCNSYLTQKTIYGKLREKCSNQNCDYTNNIYYCGKSGQVQRQ